MTLSAGTLHLLPPCSSPSRLACMAFVTLLSRSLFQPSQGSQLPALCTLRPTPIHQAPTHPPMSGAKASSVLLSPATPASCGCACTAAACTILNCCSVSLGSRPALAASTRRKTSRVASLTLMRPAPAAPGSGPVAVAAACNYTGEQAGR